MLARQIPASSSSSQSERSVREWCRDWYDPTVYGTSPPDDPTGPRSGTFRVVRGGSYATKGTHIHSGARDKENPSAAKPDLGFRIVIFP